MIGPAAVAATLLLLCLNQVVSGAVQQAHAQQHQALSPAKAQPACSTIADIGQRQLCLLRLRSAVLAAADD